MRFGCSIGKFDEKLSNIPSPTIFLQHFQLPDSIHSARIISHFNQLFSVDGNVLSNISHAFNLLPYLPRTLGSLADSSNSAQRIALTECIRLHETVKVHETERFVRKFVW